MSQERKPKEIHVENLVIYAKNVEVREERGGKHSHRDPWGFFWGRNQAEAAEEHTKEND